MFILTILEKIKKTRIKSSQESVMVSLKMANYEEVGVKLTNTHLDKLKSAAKSRAGTTLTITKRKVQDE